MPTILAILVAPTPGLALHLLRGETLLQRAIALARTLTNDIVLLTKDAEERAAAAQAGISVDHAPTGTFPNIGSIVAAVGTFNAARSASVDSVLLINALAPLLLPSDLVAITRPVEGKPEAWAAATNFEGAVPWEREAHAGPCHETRALYAWGSPNLLLRSIKKPLPPPQDVYIGDRGFRVTTPRDLAIAELLLEHTQWEALLPTLRAIKFLVLDFDGVWTNNQVVVMQDGTEAVLCNRSDGLGLTRLRESGLPIAVLTAEMNPVPLRRCEKLKIPCVQVPRDKLPALKDMIAQQGVAASEVCYVGNDVNDIECFRHAGLSVAVADAHPAARAAAKAVTSAKGGYGAVREVVDWFLKARGPHG